MAGARNLASQDWPTQNQIAARGLYVKALSRRVFSCAFLPGSLARFLPGNLMAYKEKNRSLASEKNVYISEYENFITLCDIFATSTLVARNSKGSVVCSVAGIRLPASDEIDARAGGELVEARGLAIVLRKAATALFPKDPEIELSVSVALVGGEFVEPHEAL